MAQHLRYILSVILLCTLSAKYVGYLPYYLSGEDKNISLTETNEAKDDKKSDNDQKNKSEIVVYQHAEQCYAAILSVPDFSNDHLQTHLQSRIFTVPTPPPWA